MTAMTVLRRPHSRGFTLIELLVSLTASVGIIAGAYLCLHGGLQSRKICEERRDIAQTARAVLSLLAADLRIACPLPGKDEFVGMRREIQDMEADNVDFATHNWRPRRPGETDFCEVSYFVDRDDRSDGFCLYRRRDASPDEDPMDGGSRELLARDIAGFRLEYSDGYSWYENWGVTSSVPRDRSNEDLSTYNLGGLPDTVRITLVFRSPGNGELFRSERQGKAVEKKSGGSLGMETEADPGAAPDPEPQAPAMPYIFQTVVRLELARRAAMKFDLPSSSSGKGGVETGEETKPDATGQEAGQ